MRAVVVIFLAALVVLLSALRPTPGAPATADALGAADAIEAESGAEEESSSEDDAARLQAADAPRPAGRRTKRASDHPDDPLREGHRRFHFRPPIA